MKKLLFVVGTRPNFIKVTQFSSVLSKFKDVFDYKIIHTGQHFDDKMSSIFFEQFNLKPNIFLGISSNSPITQMAEIMLGVEKVAKSYHPDVIIVPGDVNSTLAAALVANKMGIKLAHLESGLRSFDRTMPEEHNRKLTDEIADYCFVTEQSGIDNLLIEGKSKEKVFFVGNTMIDTLIAFQEEIQDANILELHSLEKEKFALMTMHRPATVDRIDGLLKLFDIIKLITSKYKLVFPMHPRTMDRIEKFNLKDKLNVINNLALLPPLDYFAFQKLIANCKFVITDSGGIQEETTFCQVPCLTLRENTERPVTTTLGINQLVPFNKDVINLKIEEIADGKNRKGTIPPLWDGKATERIVKKLIEIL